GRTGGRHSAPNIKTVAQPARLASESAGRWPRPSKRPVCEANVIAASARLHSHNGARRVAIARPPARHKTKIATPGTTCRPPSVIAPPAPQAVKSHAAHASIAPGSSIGGGGGRLAQKRIRKTARKRDQIRLAPGASFLEQSAEMRLYSVGRDAEDLGDLRYPADLHNREQNAKLCRSQLELIGDRLWRRWQIECCLVYKNSCH